MGTTLTLFVTAARGTTALLADELRALGATDVRERAGGVACTGALATAYRACLWSRVAHRVLLVLGHATGGLDALCAAAAALPWEEHVNADGSIAVDFTAHPDLQVHERYGAQRIKDAIVDRFRARSGRRPSVSRERPDLRVNAHLGRSEGVLAVDLAGTSLHQRGYRIEAGPAPLRETLAAAVLLRSGWPAIARAGGAFVDPMCGAGTLLIEAALIAGDVAPGLLRRHFGLLTWPAHDAALWERVRGEALARREAGRAAVPALLGMDHDRQALDIARANIGRAGLDEAVALRRCDVAAAAPPPGARPGLLCVNPPYGARLATGTDLVTLYAALGATLRQRFAGWRAALLAGDPALARHVGLRATRRHVFWNGPIECRLLRFEVPAEPVQAALATAPAPDAPHRYTGHTDAVGFANRLRKSHRHLARWARREGITCYRVYDADLPEFALAADLYEDADGGRWLHVQEYAPPPRIDAALARHRLQAALAVLREVFGVGRERVSVKRRARQRGSAQYRRQDGGTGHFIEVREGRCRLLVNLTDHLDTGLFLDHRPTRRLLGELAAGGRFLNLFCYTAAATVHAALGGATTTTSVDMSATYLEWAHRNLTLNGLDQRRHRLERADCREWLRAAARAASHYDIVFLDPPTFSNSKRMRGILDVQRDHVALVRAALGVLAPGGELVFSNNRRDFELDGAALSDLVVEDISTATLPPDFARNPRIHRCWRIRRPGEAPPRGREAGAP